VRGRQQGALDDMTQQVHQPTQTQYLDKALRFDDFLGQLSMWNFPIYSLLFCDD
jgi:hypothetical protein